MKRKLSVIAVIVITAAIVAPLALFLARPLYAPGLAIHLPDDWSKVNVSRPGFAGEWVFKAGSAISLVPLEYGDYEIEIEFRDGTKATLDFTHTDAGVRRRIDIAVSRPHNPGEIKVRYAINGIQEIHWFTAKAKDTLNKPLVLDTI